MYAVKWNSRRIVKQVFSSYEEARNAARRWIANKFKTRNRVLGQHGVIIYKV